MRRRFAVLGLFALLFALGWWAGRGRAATDLYARLDIFVEVLQKVRDGYVQEVEPDKLIHGAVTGMLRDLDPYAEYLDARSLDRRDSRGSSAADAGLTLGSHAGLWTVIAPLPGGPAERAGVRAGDFLLQVDGRSTGSWTLRETLESLRGAAGTSVKLSLIHAGDDAPRTVTLVREPVRPVGAPVAFPARDGVGYLRLTGFEPATAGLVRKAISALRSRGVRRLVLDVRRCATGSAGDGAQVAELFLPRGTTLMRTRSRARASDERLEAAASDPNQDWPLAVLADGGSAGASEVLAGALQDADRALVVGRRTFGLGSVQTDLPLPGGVTVLSLTTALRETPSGRPIQKLAATDADDSDDDLAPSDSAAVSSGRDWFRTRSGRRIAGGGGIAPDVEVGVDQAAAALPADSTAAGLARLAADPAAQRAIEVLRRSRAPRDVFATVSPGGENPH